jgi:3'-phosphoadenosine 5'-phosphosulfate sulfotransferase (PAPS reductase)/FAD synthetase
MMRGGDRRTLALIRRQTDEFRRRLDSGLLIVARALAESRRPYIAFSGGKDSTALCGLVHLTAPEVPLLWSDSELELPETLEYIAAIQRAAPDQITLVESTSLHAGWFWSWRDRPFFRDTIPGTIRMEHPRGRAPTKDDWQAGRGYDLVFTGLRMDENRRRRDWLAAAGPLYSVKSGCGRRCCPLWDWTEDDVWALIHGWKLAYNAAYDRMEEADIPHRRQRVGPLPLAPRRDLEAAYPALLAQLEARYARRWDE